MCGLVSRRKFLSCEKMFNIFSLWKIVVEKKTDHQAPVEDFLEGALLEKEDEEDVEVKEVPVVITAAKEVRLLDFIELVHELLLLDENRPSCLVST
jgi:hypothetical protein